MRIEKKCFGHLSCINYYKHNFKKISIKLSNSRRKLKKIDINKKKKNLGLGNSINFFLEKSSHVYIGGLSNFVI